VDFAGAILQSISWGRPRLSAGYVPESLLLAVPRFLWNSKLALGTGMDPAQLQIDDFGLQQINYIPGMVGTSIGMLSLPELLLLLSVLGIVFGRLERWLLRECTPARVILLAGAITTALLYDASPDARGGGACPGGQVRRAAAVRPQGPVACPRRASARRRGAAAAPSRPAGGRRRGRVAAASRCG
jgi:hypothetical protein